MVLTGYATAYWQVVLCRVALAPLTSMSGPLCLALLSDFFPSQIRASACALWSLAIYIGFSGAYGAGNAVAQALGDWRYAWWLFGFLGVAWAAVVLCISSARRQTHMCVPISQLCNQKTSGTRRLRRQNIVNMNTRYLLLDGTSRPWQPGCALGELDQVYICS